ncbi:MAG: siroheme synthase CysG [Hyphomicrobiaceae bacterium]
MQAIRKPAETRPSRLGSLAKLPVFLDLEGRRVVVAGGSPAAAWKVELIAAAGADVQVHALDVSSELGALLERGAAAGKITLHRRIWSPSDLAGAAIAIADADSIAEARAFHLAGTAAGAKVNVIDKPEFCDFQFGSIVNRSPVVIGISTDGAAPILGQAIRRRIETLLPPAVAQWATLAKSIRGRIAGVLHSPSQRRAFWEQFCDRAFRGAPTDIDGAELAEMLPRLAPIGAQEDGRVTLVGAGPGNAELLTLKAVRTLQSADVILFDDLVSDDVLELARREAKRMLVGKRGGRASCSQADINALMIKLARQGKHVVRLKSGDPMIFGRAGEEIDALRAEGIQVTVVPGITSASAMASVLSVSLTHRCHAHSVRFVTGHSHSGGLAEDLDWRSLADGGTLVFYMGARTAPHIAERLMASGRSPRTPVAVVSSVTRPEEKRWLGTLDTLGNAMASFDVSAPVILGIGEVFAQAGLGSSVVAAAADVFAA